MKNPPLSASELADYELTHDHAGNGWVMVADYPEYDCCHVTMTGARPANGQVFLAWKPKLTISQSRTNHKDLTSPLVNVRIDNHTLPDLIRLRKALQEGRMEIVNTRIVPAL